MKVVYIQKENNDLKGRVSLPPSKSITNRLLIINALTAHPFEISNISTADDAKVMQHLLSEINTNKYINDPLVLDAGNTGTALRFLTAYLAVQQGTYILTGSERMKIRPVKELVSALCGLGADIHYLENEGYPPLRIKGKVIKGGKISIDASKSSQFVTALMLIAPVLKKGLELELICPPSSWPYIQMTAGLMELCGVKVHFSSQKIIISPQPYHSKGMHVEADWTAASYWYEAAALAGNVDLEIDGLTDSSFQGDRYVAELFKGFGVISTFTESGCLLSKTDNIIMPQDQNFINHPDLVPSMAVTCAARGIPAKLRRLENLRIKESDRLISLKSELRHLGFEVEVGENNTLYITGKSSLSTTDEPIHTYGDHRIAMAFSPLALMYNKICIEDPDVVGKSYPDYWNAMMKVGFRCKVVDSSAER